MTAIKEVDIFLGGLRPVGKPIKLSIVAMLCHSSFCAINALTVSLSRIRSW